MNDRHQIVVEVSDTVYKLLAVLGDDVEAVVSQLIDHAQQGVYRPGAWEREWVCQAFGHEWFSKMEPGDPYNRSIASAAKLFERPRRRS